VAINLSDVELVILNFSVNFYDSSSLHLSLCACTQPTFLTVLSRSKLQQIERYKPMLSSGSEFSAFVQIYPLKGCGC